MDTVLAFNQELSGLYDIKPPISKAKMSSITRSAMKAIKFYKHVVQSVEKFIQKCRTEYKIPGIYVIDSIVRQSRHQFGADKDVFAPRFARNIQTTFVHLFKCPVEEKGRLIRVLNLWQKNNVFAPEVIQPLFDLADPNNPLHQQLSAQMNELTNSNGMNTSGPAPHTHHESPAQEQLSMAMSSEMSNTGNPFDSNTIRQLQQLQQLLIRQTSGDPAPKSEFWDRILGQDSEDEDDDKTNKKESPHNQAILEGNSISQLLKDPNVLQQLQTLQKLKQHEMEEKQTKLTEMRIQEEKFEKHLADVLKKLPFANECDLSRQPPTEMQGNSGGKYGMKTAAMTSNYMHTANMSSMNDQNEPEVEFIADEGKVEVINLDGNDSRSPSPDRDRYKRRRSRTRSRDRSGRDRRRRSRSPRSRTRSPRSRRRSSRDRGKEKERDKEREYDRERRRKGLPDLKKEHLSVCSTTLWVGHLSKLVQQEELSDTFGKYGDIVSIDMIHPRGCAFIVMNRRQDSYKAMNSLKSHKMQGRAITISWAAGKGVKSKEWKDYWDIELGVSYVPWDKLGPNSDLEALEEGGMFDEDSMPQWLKDKILQLNKNKEKIESLMNPTGMFNMGDVDTSQPPPASSMMSNVPMVPPFALGPRLMPPSMGMMPPNMVPGMPLPPPQMMMTGAPPGMVPGMPPQMTMDKSIPPPNLNSVVNQSKPALSDVFLNHLASIAGHQASFQQIPMPPHIPSIAQLTGMTTISSNDDHMDIEMEDDMVTHNPKSLSGDLGINMFNRPPPLISGQNNMPNNFDDRRDDRGRDRERDRSRDRGGDRRDRDRENNRERERSRDYNIKDNRMSRWGGDESRSRDRDGGGHHRDRERSKERLDKGIQDRLRNIAGDPMIPDFTRREPPPSLLDLPLNDEWNGPPRNFMDMPPHIMRDGPMGPGNRPPLMRPDDMFDMRRDNDFNRMDDFERRGGGNNGGRDFFQQQNRFGPGNGPRGPPMGMGRGGPPPFGHRGGPMFMRGPRPGNFHERPAYMDREFSYEREERNDRSERGGPRGNRGMERRGGGLGGRQWRDTDDDQQQQRGGNRSDRRSQSRETHSREPRERRFSNSSQWTDEETNQEKAVNSEKKSTDDCKISKLDENSSSVVEPDCENLSSSNDFEDNGPQESDDNSEKISNNNTEIIVPDPPIIRIEQEEDEEVENIVEQTTPLYDEAPTESVEKQSEEKTNSTEE